MGALISIQIIADLTVELRPVWLKRDIGIWPTDAYKVAGGQLSHFLSSHPSSSQPVGLLIGSSVSYVGFDTKEMENRARPRLPWVRLSVFGSTICELEPMVDHFLDQNRKPAVAILAIELKQFARNPAYRHLRFDERVVVHPQQCLHDLQSLHLITCFKNCEKVIENAFNEVFPDRARVMGRLKTPLTRLRIAILSQLGQNAVSAFSPDWQVWSKHLDNPETIPTSGPKRDQFIEKQWSENEGRGSFDSRFYSADSETGRSLVRMIRRLRDAGSNVVIVVMPATSTFRAKEPSNAMTTLEQLLELNFPTDPPALISLRDTVPDDLYYDISHFTSEGTRLLTAQLIEKLNQLALTAPEATLATPPPTTR